MSDQNIAIPAQGTTFEIEDAVTADTWYAIGGRKSINFAEGESAENNETVLTSTANEYSVGLPDSGQYSETIQYNRADPGQQQLHAAKAASQKRNFRLTLSDGQVATFSGFVKSVPFTGNVGQSLEGNYTIRISGAIAWA